MCANTPNQRLEELGYKVLVAHDSARALRIVNDGTHIDLLFTDIVLPGGMNGRHFRTRR